jgi:hypothetical protein
MKKILASMLAVSLLLCSMSVISFAEENINLTYEQQIFNQVEELTGIETEKAEIITVENNIASARKSNSEKAIKIEIDDGVIVIVPKIANEDNEVVNSFEYAESKAMTRDSHFPVTHLVDLTVNMSAYYNSRYIGNTQVGWIFTPKSMYFSWNSNNSTARVDDIAVKFDAKGDYWKISPLTDMGYEKYVSFDIYEVLPTEGVAYGDWEAAMNDNYGIACPDYMEHGGNIWYSINYTVNGVTRYDTYSWTPFTDIPNN